MANADEQAIDNAGAGLPVYPFPYFAAFTVSPPVVPDYYWNVYSQEERIKAICLRIERLVAYVDAMADTVNKQYEMIRELKETIEEINRRLQALETGKSYGDIKEHGFIYSTLEE